MEKLPTLQDLKAAHQRIKAYTHKTPVLTSEHLNGLTEAQLYFKCENFQKVGAFKMRGASNAVFSLSKEKAAKGVCTHSSGNHAQALAKAAKSRGIPAFIVMPETAPKVKVEAVKGYGAEVVFCEPTLAAREESAERLVETKGATFIHPYNDYRVIAGQATCALELWEQQPGLEVITAPVGGGGLMSGTCLATHYLYPGATIIGGEPKGADDAFRSLEAGKLLPSESPKTIADGLLTSLGDKTFPILKEHLFAIVTVTDDEIITAMRLIWERMKIIVEPSCAVPLAAIFKEKSLFKGKKVGVVLTGGNVDLGNLPF